MASDLPLTWDGQNGFVDAGVDDDQRSETSHPPVSTSGRSAKRKAAPKSDASKRRKKADEVEYLSTSFTCWRKTPEPLIILWLAS